MTIEEIRILRETEDKVESKAASGGNFSYNAGDRINPKARRRCILGYVVALANEKGGKLILGLKDDYPHTVIGTNQCLNATGKLEQDIYNDLQIRIKTEELFDENNRRVLNIHIPSRRPGKLLKFEDVSLMRVGEELLPMSDEQYLEIIQESEPDFSATICKNLHIDDLDKAALKKLKEDYSRKQNNLQFLTLNDIQILNDLELIREGELTYAALILLGKEKIIKKIIPQSAIILEYRTSEAKIPFDQRKEFKSPYYLGIDILWNSINERNGIIPVHEGPYIFDIPLFSREVIRESINNAIAHRDYQIQSEVVIKLYPNKFVITNPGGFPLGVNINNLLTINSTPRNRLLTEILAKTGIVERSGQGVDKIFYQCITESKGLPDYSKSDDYQVELIIPGIVRDKAFFLFINQIQQDKSDEEKLSVQDVIILDLINQGADKSELNLDVVNKLYNEKLIEKVGRTRKLKYRLSKIYYSFIGQEGRYSKETPLNEEQIFSNIYTHLKRFKSAQIKDFVQIFGESLSREQIKDTTYKLVKMKILETHGKGKGTKYILSKKAREDEKLFDMAVELGFKEMRKKGEIPNDI